MLDMIKGCKIQGAQQLEERYEVNEFEMIANVNAGKIEEVLRHFIITQNSLLFFVLELPANEKDERKLREDDTDPMHKDIYYIDGLNSNDALLILRDYGNLLINDGLSSFGFGVHDNTAEIMIGKYNVITLWTNSMEKYVGFFDTHNIKRIDKLVTAWDTFDSKSPGECFCYEVDGKNVYSLLDELKSRGIYFAEQREE